MKKAKQLFVSVMGAWMGIAGIEHGIGEIMQGDVTASGVMILSWPDSPFFVSLNGEPAMTLISNLLVTGIFATSISLMFVVWAIFFSMRKYGGVVMILLSIPMLLFGGGLFPPILGALIGVAAIIQPKNFDPKKMKRLNFWFGNHWRWFFIACCFAWLALLPGLPAIAYFFNKDVTWLTVATMFMAFLLLFLSYWSSLQHDLLMTSISGDPNFIKSKSQDLTWRMY